MVTHLREAFGYRADFAGMVFSRIRPRLRVFASTCGGPRALIE